MVSIFTILFCLWKSLIAHTDTKKGGFLLYLYSFLIIIGILILTLILMILFIDLRVMSHTIYTNQERIMIVKISMLKNLLRYKFIIPLKPNEVKEELKHLEKKRDISIFQQIDFFINLYSNAHTIIIRFLQSVQIYNVNYHVHFGVGNSAITGVSIGAAYSMIGVIENILERFTILHKPPNIDITPNYYATIIEANGKIRFSFSIRKAVYTGFLMFLAYRKTRKEFQVTHPFESISR